MKKGDFFPKCTLEKVPFFVLRQEKRALFQSALWKVPFFRPNLPAMFDEVKLLYFLQRDMVTNMVSTYSLPLSDRISKSNRSKYQSNLSKIKIKMNEVWKAKAGTYCEEFKQCSACFHFIVVLFVQIHIQKENRKEKQHEKDAKEEDHDSWMKYESHNNHSGLSMDSSSRSHPSREAE